MTTQAQPTIEATQMLAELDAEASATRRVLERVPADRLTWKPHPKSLTLGQLARHVARIPGDLAHIARDDSFDNATPRNVHAQPESAAELMPALEASLTAARAFLEELTEAKAAAPWRMMDGPREIFAIPRRAFVRSVLLNHWYHHRAQLMVYLRLLDVPVPAVYGGSADEKAFG
ncbi:MAG TPA: DinB family protein [Thermoanaerobaculia bacterium]|jgi:uncharacterized damage-inducible protein DinB